MGRWPPNALLEHHPDCICVGTKTVKLTEKVVKIDYAGEPPKTEIIEQVEEEVEAWDCHPECPVKALNDQSGDVTSVFFKQVKVEK